MSDFLTLKGGEVDVGGAPEVISVLPFGHVVSQKGEFDVDEESLAAMKAQIAERGVDLVVDYEHQTLTGDRAPAAGWVKELFAEDGHIKARVEWTLPAKQYLENKEYIGVWEMNFKSFPNIGYEWTVHLLESMHLAKRPC